MVGGDRSSSTRREYGGGRLWVVVVRTALAVKQQKTMVFSHRFLSFKVWGSSTLFKGGWWCLAIVFCLLKFGGPASFSKGAGGAAAFLRELCASASLTRRAMQRPRGSRGGLRRSRDRRRALPLPNGESCCNLRPLNSDKRRL